MAPDQLKGFRVLGGRWQVRQGELSFSGARGDKIVSKLPAFRDGEVGVEVYIPDRSLTNAGLIVRADRAEAGADRFDGYEVAINAAEQSVLLGRHRQNFERLQTAPCEVPTGQWVSLVVKLSGSVIEVSVNGKNILRYDDGRASLPAGAVGLRQWQREARYRNVWVKSGGRTQPLVFEAVSNESLNVSGTWRPVRSGEAKGTFALETDRPFVGRQSQRLTFDEGMGQVGVENQGLNRWGMYFAEGKPYEGVLWVRSAVDTELFVALESRDGSQQLAEERLSVRSGEWQRLGFTLTPKVAGSGRLAVTLRNPGSVALGYAFLQPGDWGRFKGLPVRRDVAEALIDQGVTVLRYGGSMVNHAEYRWKKMIGPRDRRPPCTRHLVSVLVERLGHPRLHELLRGGRVSRPFPAFNMDETPQDMADFVDTPTAPPTANGAGAGPPTAIPSHTTPVPGTWQRGTDRRELLREVQTAGRSDLGKDPEFILVVGDFDYRRAIRDPFRFRGARADHDPGHPAEDPGTGQGTRARGLVRRPCGHGRPAARRYLRRHALLH